jgi:hypothetical protein
MDMGGCLACFAFEGNHFIARTLTAKSPLCSFAEWAFDKPDFQVWAILTF